MKDKLLICMVLLLSAGLGACGSTDGDVDSEEEEAIKIGETVTDELDASLETDEMNTESLADNSDSAAPDYEAPGFEANPVDESMDFFAEESGQDSAPSEETSVADNSPIEDSTSGADPVTPDTQYESPEPFAGTGSESESYAGSSGGAGSGLSGDWGEHHVVKGETLMKIAFNIYGDIDKWRTLYSENLQKFRNGRPLMVGMKLKYQRPLEPFVRDTSGESYLIKDGDSLGGIALELYGRVSKWRKVFERNRDLIKDPNKIYAGFWLYYHRSQDEITDAGEYRRRRSASINNYVPPAPEPAPPPAAPQPEPEVAHEESPQPQESAGIMLPPEQQPQGPQGPENAGNNQEGDEFEDYRFPSGSF